jgi:hypothetical protein
MDKKTNDHGTSKLFFSLETKQTCIFIDEPSTYKEDEDKKAEMETEDIEATNLRMMEQRKLGRFFVEKGVLILFIL